MIHILVVSGGHLTLLATILTRLLVFVPHSVARWMVSAVLILFSLANRLQPPVLRALLEWLFKDHLRNRGWKPPEISLLSTWIALPFCQSSFDALSLSLSFFASVTVERTSHHFHRRPLLALLVLQTALWWILLPLLFTLGVPHPLVTLVNIALAPVLGVTLIPLAMSAWVFSSLSPAFDFVWMKTAKIIAWLATNLPKATPRLEGPSPLFFGFETNTIFLLTIFTATAALVLRHQRVSRQRSLSVTAGPIILTITALAISVLVYEKLQTDLKTEENTEENIETPRATAFKRGRA